jgi:hypothetical protein
MSSQKMILQQSTYRVRMPETSLKKALGHRSLSMFVSKSQFGIAELNENGISKNKTRFDVT